MDKRVGNKEIIISHPTGNQNVRGVLEGLLCHELLYQFYTGIACFSESLYYPLLKGPLENIRKRTFNSSLKPYTRTYPYFEIGRLLFAALNVSNRNQSKNSKFNIDHVYRSLDTYVAGKLDKSHSVYAYEDGALASFLRAKELGIPCFYDLPTAYWQSYRTLLKDERYRNPEWESTFTSSKDSDEKLSDKSRELALADLVFVASSFTKESVAPFMDDNSRVIVVPYGFPEVINENEILRPHTNKMLKVLYVGKISQQKGFADLLSAVKGLEKYVELTIVGNLVGQVPNIKQILSRHNYLGTLPHHEVLKVMRQSDILVFPSLLDGFGMVITEAMSQGTPVIASRNSAGPDFINHNENGWLINAGSVTEIRESLEYILADKKIIRDVAAEAIFTAKARPWALYGREISDTIINYLDKTV